MPDIQMYRGDNASLMVTIADPGGGATDLTGAAITWTARRRHGAPVVLFKSIGSGVTVDAPSTAGIWRVTINPADTESFPDRFVELVMDCELVRGSDVRTVFVGTLTIKPDVST